MSLKLNISFLACLYLYLNLEDTMLKGIVSRDKEGVLMIPTDGGQVFVVPLGGLKFLKCHFPLKF
jgi:hypothetical protein